MAVTSPLVVPIVAVPVVPLSHKPPGVASVSVAVAPTHMPDMPLMVAGAATTVIARVAVQPLPRE